MGSFLNGKSVKEWQKAFDRLKEIPLGNIHEIMRIVIDGLEANERTIFLDIACFLNGYDHEEIIESLDQCGIYANSGIEILAQRSLIYIDENNKIWMHDLLQEIGRRIVIQECPANPSKRSRIWHHEDALQVVRQHSGTDAIEGIKLDKVDVEDLIVNAVSFKNMKKLRLFIMSDQVPHCGLAGHLSEKLRRRFARNNNNMFARWEAVLKQISKGELHRERENWWEGGVLAGAGTGSDSRQGPAVVSSIETTADQAVIGPMAGVAHEDSHFLTEGDQQFVPVHGAHEQPQEQLSLKIVPSSVLDHSPEDTPEVRSPTTPDSCDDSDVVVGYKLPDGHNRGKPPSRYSPDVEE
ncbi:TMV resistance protein N-like [Syzygium oleosum]|uniref:TMV resistance protein N-like n=1 Tax=Syzygium oleosum TaxID=219896 RepID=UPI0024B9D35A|nr:TMV resistance protein N-like [Syzygium oleosum]